MGNVNSLRGILREELTTQLADMKEDMLKTIDAKIKTVADENEKLLSENVAIKAVLQEHQKARKEETKNNIFISGIPNLLKSYMSGIPVNDEEESTNDYQKIIHHILSFVNPDIRKEDYKILVNFEAREKFSRHSAKIRVENMTTKTNLFKGCKNFKEVGRTSYLKKIFIKNDDPPLTRKENERLGKKMKELREVEDADNPVNRYHIKGGKLFKNGDECVDTFNLNNQLFQ